MPHSSIRAAPPQTLLQSNSLKKHSGSGSVQSPTHSPFTGIASIQYKFSEPGFPNPSPSVSKQYVDGSS